MFNLIPISLLISSIGGIIYIMSSHLSELNNIKGKNDDFGFSFKARFTDWVNQLPLDSLKSQSLSLTQKMLHRLRLFLLKSDNSLMKLIGKISQHKKYMNGNNEVGGPAIDFWGDFSKKQQKNQVVTPRVEPEIKVDFAMKSETAKKFFDIKPVKKALKTKKSPR